MLHSDRWLRWLLGAAVVFLPATAGCLCGYVVAVDIARGRGADMMPAAWLGLPMWFAGLAVTGVATALGVVRPLRRRVDGALLRVGIASLLLAGFLCALTSVLVPL